MNDVAAVLAEYKTWDHDDEQGYTELIEMASERMIPALEAAEADIAAVKNINQELGITIQRLNAQNARLRELLGHGLRAVAFTPGAKEFKPLMLWVADANAAIEAGPCKHERWETRLPVTQEVPIKFATGWHTEEGYYVGQKEVFCASCGTTADRVQP